jgi:hypothetical protein
MLMRCVSTIQILAILVCPLGCGAGYGLGLECCPTTPSPVSESSDASHTCCGSHEEPTSGTTDDSRSSPPSSPKMPSCQCICGGAVFAKQCEELTGETCVSSFSDAPSTYTPTCPSPHQFPLIAVREIGGKNIGRFLCTMHASFLC